MVLTQFATIGVRLVHKSPLPIRCASTLLLAWVTSSLSASFSCAQANVAFQMRPLVAPLLAPVFQLLAPLLAPILNAINPKEVSLGGLKLKMKMPPLPKHANPAAQKIVNEVMKLVTHKLGAIIAAGVTACNTTPPFPPACLALSSRTSTRTA